MQTFEEMQAGSAIRVAEQHRDEIIDRMITIVCAEPPSTHDRVWMSATIYQLINAQCEFDTSIDWAGAVPAHEEPQPTDPNQPLNFGVPEDIFSHLMGASIDELRHCRARAQKSFDKSPRRETWAYITTVNAIAEARPTAEHVAAPQDCDHSVTDRNGKCYMCSQNTNSNLTFLDKR